MTNSIYKTYNNLFLENQDLIYHDSVIVPNIVSYKQAVLTVF